MQHAVASVLSRVSSTDSELRPKMRRGSTLRRLSDHHHPERPDYLFRLLAKRRLRKRLLQRQPRSSNSVDMEASVDNDNDNETMTDIDDNENSVDDNENMDDYEQLKREVLQEIESDSQQQQQQQLQRVQELMTTAENVPSLERPLQVRLKNYSYSVRVNSHQPQIETVYNASLLYPLYKWIQRQWNGQGCLDRHKYEQKTILDRIDLCLEPGQLYLVLGAPGSGKTTLLKAIAGRLPSSRHDQQQGEILYNGRRRRRLLHDPKKIAYIDQLDQHAPRLTVAETFQFALDCQTPPPPPQADRVQWTLLSLGLSHVAHTYVGDAAIRGVSGGQRRRVTVGEGLLTRAPVLCGDELSTGLDAASTYDMIQFLLDHNQKTLTKVISLLQPSPETVSLFDQVIVLAEGSVIYAGPVSDVEDYFANIGYVSPPFMDVADFLQLVSSQGADLYDSANDAPPPTPLELAELFRQSRLGRKIQKSLFEPYVEKDAAQDTSSASNNAKKEEEERPANSLARTTWLILRRFLTLWKRDKRVILAGAAKNILMGMSVGGVFANVEDTFSILGALFQAGLFIMLSAMQAASGLIADRVIFYKHADGGFYSSWPFVLGRTLSTIPQVSVVGCVCVFGRSCGSWFVDFIDRDGRFHVWVRALLYRWTGRT